MTMAESVSLTVAIISGIAAVVFGFLAFRRGQKHDDQTDASKLTEIETTLSFIKGGVTRIEQNQHEQSVSIAGLSERVTRVETRVDNIENKYKSA